MSLSLTVSFKVIFEYSDGSTAELQTSHLGFKGIQKHGLGRPAYVTVICEVEPRNYMLPNDLLYSIMQLKHTLKVGENMEGRVTLKPFWFQDLVYTDMKEQIQ